MVAFGAEEQTALVHVNFFKNDEYYHAQIVPYEKDLYQLGYTTYLAVGNPNYAFIVAKAAVQQHPQQTEWRVKLATVALWDSQPYEALDQWTYLAEQDHDKYALNQAIKLARQLNDGPIIAKLLTVKATEHEATEDEWEALITALNNIGHQQEALALLKTHFKFSNKLRLDLIARTHRLSGDWQKELTILNERVAKYGTTPQIALRQAEILYLDNQFKASLQKLKAAVNVATPKDKAYWRTLAQLAWREQDVNAALLAFNNLEKGGNANAEDYNQWIYLVALKNPAQAFQMSLTAWRKYQQTRFLIAAMTYGQQAGRWAELQHLLNSLNRKELQALQELESYWPLRAILAERNGDITGAMQAYEQGMRRFPANKFFLRDYFSLIIRRGSKAQLWDALQRWQNKLLADPLAEPMIADIYMKFDRPDLALQVYRKLFHKYKNDYAWVLSYSDLLESFDHPAQAFKLRQYAFPLLIKQMQKEAQIPVEQLLAFARMAEILHLPNRVIIPVLNRLYKMAPRAETDAGITAWALANENYALARRFVNYDEMHQIPVQPWIKLSMALHDDDQYAMSDLLDHQMSELPYRDRVTAASKIGDNKLAQQLAYRGLAEHPHDYLMYQLFEQTMLPAAPYALAGFAYYTRGPGSGPANHLGAKVNLSPSLSAVYRGITWFPKSTDPAQLANTPSVYLRQLLAFHNLTHAGYVEGSVGLLRGQESNLTLLLDWQRQWSTAWSTLIHAAYQEYTDDTVALTLGGMRNDLSITSDYRFAESDILSVQLRQDYYYGQDQVSLGAGQSVFASWNHKFRYEYPDWNASVYGEVHGFSQKYGVQSNIFNLIPNSDVTTRVIPQSFNQYGISLGFGQNLQQDYTYRWKPFATGSLFINSVTNLGKSFIIGVAGSVIGRDHLVFYYDYSTAQEGVNQITRIIGFNYQIYF